MGVEAETTTVGERRESLARRASRVGWPSSAAGRVLLALIVAGVALRALAVISWWPVTPTLDDGYQMFAANPFLDAQHSAGYGLIVGALGDITRQIAFTVLLQHLAGVLSALLVGAATRRATGSDWAGLLPAAIVLLDPDQIFLEHSIMSESWVIFALAAGFYAAVRACETPQPWFRWPMLAGAAFAAAGMIRSAALPVIPVVALAVLLWSPRPFRRPRQHLRAAPAMLGAAAVLMFGFGSAYARYGRGFAITPSPGWYLYGRAAQFADCSKFTPPPGTQALCQSLPANRRRDDFYYLFDPSSPAVRLFGGLGHQDGVVGSWARRALEAQFGDFLSTGWAYLRAYWFPGWLPARLGPVAGDDPQLDFTYRNPFFVGQIHHDLERYYDRFTVHPIHRGLQILHDVRTVLRFGPTALLITTFLTLIGLAIGPRRVRIGVLLFGVGGISLIVAPALTVTYTARYTLPMAAPLIAAAAITLTEIWRRVAAQRRPHRGAAATSSAAASPER